MSLSRHVSVEKVNGIILLLLDLEKHPRFKLLTRGPIFTNNNKYATARPP